jgi:hypothetical protein
VSETRNNTVNFNHEAMHVETLVKKPCPGQFGLSRGKLLFIKD